MKSLFYFASLLLLLSACNNNPVKQESPPVKKINVGYNRTIETIMILRAIHPEDPLLKYRSDTDKGRPMLYKARQHFAKYKEHPAVAATQEILAMTQDIGGRLFQGIMYAEELPGTTLKYNITDDFWKQHKTELSDYMQALGTFYNDADVEGFLKENQQFYNGAIAEAKQYINDSITGIMEDYFGKANASYDMYLLTMSPFGTGFSVTTTDSEGNHQYAIVSPVGDVDWNDTDKNNKGFGFDGEEAPAYYRELVVHEFAHSFITDVIMQDSFRKQIAQYDTLFTPALDSVMQELAYGDWWGFVNEHFTRLGHIRVMEIADKNEANELRKADKEYGFVLMPEAEERIREYENNRAKYKTIDDFLPVLIRQFGTFNREYIDRKLTAK